MPLPKAHATRRAVFQTFGDRHWRSIPRGCRVHGVADGSAAAGRSRIGRLRRWRRECSNDPERGVDLRAGRRCAGGPLGSRRTSGYGHSTDCVRRATCFPAPNNGRRSHLRRSRAFIDHSRVGYRGIPPNRYPLANSLADLQLHCHSDCHVRRAMGRSSFRRWSEADQPWRHTDSGEEPDTQPNPRFPDAHEYHYPDADQHPDAPRDAGRHGHRGIQPSRDSRRRGDEPRLRRQPGQRQSLDHRCAQ